ncbi:hypothetical protein CR513_29517, partial [Mucuna pruriens]
MKRLEAKLRERLERMEKENKEGLDSVKRNTQSVNAKVEALSRGKEKNRQPFMQESEASHEEGHVSGSSRSHRSHRHAHNEKVERHGRHRREMNELRRDELEKRVEDRFVPSYYAMDLYAKLQRFYQGSKSVEEYHKEMEVCRIRAQIVESQQATMARFLRGLNREIQDIVELNHCHNLEDLVHLVAKVELQLERKSTSRKPYPSKSGSGKERGSPIKDKSHKKGSETPKGQKDERVTSSPNSSRFSSIKCFKCLGKKHLASQCPNKRTIVLRENGEVEVRVPKESLHLLVRTKGSSQTFSPREVYEDQIKMRIKRKEGRQEKEKAEKVREKKGE